jgi:hypothetical protein
MALRRAIGIVSPQTPQIRYLPVSMRRIERSISAKVRTSRSILAMAVPVEELRRATPHFVLGLLIHDHHLLAALLNTATEFFASMQ